MAAYGYADPVIAGMTEGVADALTVDPVVLQEVVPFGKPLFGYRGQSIPVKAWAWKQDVTKIVYSTAFITANSTIVTVNGVTTSAVVYATSHAATIAAVVAAVKAIPVSAANPLGVDCVLDPTDGSSLTIEIRTKSVTCTATSATTLGGSQPTTTVTQSNGQIFLGVHRIRHDDPTKSPVSGDIVDCVRIGTVWATADTTPVMGDIGVVNTSGNFGNSGMSIASVRYESTSADTPATSAGNMPLPLVKVSVLGKTTMPYGAAF